MFNILIPSVKAVSVSMPKMPDICIPRVLLPDDSSSSALLLPFLATFYYQSVQLEELADNSLSLHPIHQHCPEMNVVGNQRCEHVTELAPRKRPTFNICSSFSPFCIKSCRIRSSVSLRCSRNASFVRRFAYSLKLYAANWLACRSSWRYCPWLTSPVLFIIARPLRSIAMVCWTY